MYSFLQTYLALFSLYSPSGRRPHAIIPPPEFAPIVNVYPVITANISFPTDRPPITGGVIYSKMKDLISELT